MRIQPRTAGLAFGATLILVGSWLGVDAMVVTDEEQLEELANAVTGPVEPSRIDAALEAWTDLSREPLEVHAFGRTERYTADDTQALRGRVRQTLRPFKGERLRKMRQEIRIDGQTGRVTLRIISSRGMMDLELQLRKDGDDWLVSAVKLHR